MATTRNRVFREVNNVQNEKRKPLATLSKPPVAISKTENVEKNVDKENVTSKGFNKENEVAKKNVEQINEVKTVEDVKAVKEVVEMKTVVEVKTVEEVKPVQDVKSDEMKEVKPVQDVKFKEMKEVKPVKDVKSEEMKEVKLEEKKEIVKNEPESSEDKENIEDICLSPSGEDSDIICDLTEDLFEPHEDDWSFSKMLLCCIPEYECEIQKYMLILQERHCAKPDYMTKLTEINGKMRNILVDWMVEVVEEYKMTAETLFLAVNFVDRFLSNLGVIRSKFQLLGTTALFISSKYEEIYPPDIHEFVYITDNAYDKFDILSMEAQVLQTLEFNVSTPTTHYFLRKHLTSLGCELGLPQTVGIMAEYLCYLSLLECNPCLTYLPNDIAVSAILLSASLYGIKIKLSGETGQAFFPGFSNEQLKAHIVKLQSCVNTLYDLRKSIKTENDALFKSGKPQQAIFNKYAQEKYFSVSLMEIGDQGAPKLLL